MSLVSALCTAGCGPWRANPSSLDRQARVGQADAADSKTAKAKMERSFGWAADTGRL